MAHTETEVIIPSASWDDPTRVAARDWVAQWWESRGHRVTIAETSHKPWSKGRAVNPAIAASDAQVVIVADGDSWAPRRAIERLITHVGASGWGAPFSSVKRLDRAATARVMSQAPGKTETVAHPTLAQPPHVRLMGGGIIAATRDLWAKVGGFDPRFEGWGGEDYSLGCALRTLSGKRGESVTGDLWHLWHPPQPEARNEHPDTTRLAARYRRAKFRPVDMAALIGEWRP